MTTGRVWPTPQEAEKLSPKQLAMLKRLLDQELRHEEEEKLQKLRNQLTEIISQTKQLSQALSNIDQFRAHIDIVQKEEQENHRRAETLIKEKIEKQRALLTHNQSAKHHEKRLEHARKEQSTILPPVKKPVGKKAKPATTVTPVAEIKKTAPSASKGTKTTSATMQAAMVVNMAWEPMPKKEEKAAAKIDPKAPKPAATEEKSMFVEFNALEMPDFSHDPREDFRISIKGNSLTKEAPEVKKAEDKAVTPPSTEEQLQADIAKAQALLAPIKAKHDELVKGIQAPLFASRGLHNATMEKLRKELASLPKPRAIHSRNLIKEIFAAEKAAKDLAEQESKRLAAEAKEKADLAAVAKVKASMLPTALTSWYFNAPADKLAAELAKPAAAPVVAKTVTTPEVKADAKQADTSKAAVATPAVTPVATGTSSKNVFTDSKAAQAAKTATVAVQTAPQPEQPVRKASLSRV